MIKNTSLFSWFCLIFIKPIISHFFIKEIKGWENVPRSGKNLDYPQGNFILVANHQSHLDWISSGRICVPRKFHFIAQTDLYTGASRIFRDVLYFFSDVIRMNRKSDESKRKAVAEAERVLKKGRILILYPEGTRTRTGKIGKGKLGTAKIFLATGVPILPVAFTGAFELLPPGGKLKIKRTMRMSIGKPLYFKEEFKEAKKIDKDSVEYKQILIGITEKVMEKITSLKVEMDIKVK